jgi:Rad3-related DNA helicase
MSADNETQSQTGPETETVTFDSGRSLTLPAGLTVEILEAAWPAPGYYPRQKEIYYRAAAALYGEGSEIETVVIDAPTGIGKSPINTALCNLAKYVQTEGPGNAFYVTPQTELREQLAEDDMLKPYVANLRGRQDYVCEHDEDGNAVMCDECKTSVPGATKTDRENCRYWNAKEDAMDAQTASITFAYLMVDGYLPETIETAEGSRKVSFGDRELLCVDEAHSLEGQVANMFAGFVLRPGASKVLVDLGIPELLEDAIPASVVDAAQDRRGSAPLDDHLVDEELRDAITVAKGKAVRELESYEGKLETAAAQLEAKYETDPDAFNQRTFEVLEDLQPIEIFADAPDVPLGELIEEIQDLQKTTEELSTFIRDLELRFLENYDPEENPWLVSVQPSEYAVGYKFTPVYVDDILENSVWNRADKVVLSSATVPAYEGGSREKGIKSWASKLGRDPETTLVITEDSPFPVGNRPIVKDYVAKMSGSGFTDNLTAIEAKIRDYAARHDGEKGLIHVSSYGQANALYERLEDIAFAHLDSSEDSDAVLQAWQNSDKPIMISPRVKEGVDLHDDKCRWQVAVKVPFPMLGDPRIQYLNDERGWNWYAGCAVTALVQAGGRGVRHDSDTCTMYVIDSAFDSVNYLAPPWFKAAIQSA